MQDRPTARELLDAVRGFLQTALDREPDARTAFLVRVAANALGIVERELRLGPGLDAIERERLRALLGHDGTLTALNEELATGIRDGALDERRAEIVEHLRLAVRDKLQISNPSYLAREG